MSDLKQKIVVVEDEEALSGVLKDRLEDEGFTVAIADEGEKALQLILAEKPDLILLDVMMPKMDGIEMLKKLRAEDAFKTTPVMILTNLNDIETVKDALTYGAQDILVKSDWSVDNIVKSIREKLSLPTVT